ncbi:MULTISPECIES: hypothetical protein [unclassified Paenibacillus]|uniref:Uncharacterized protein n=1 Tax=Paenibacillus provencensis TaxID=441151 RepID=A0ABW3Q2B4_9BACL|nr:MULTISPECIES: hypothetical protein [unclassified Paenibacillus]MCM3130182.1 hypothetical protein [Paenibacillus sp. MER 78]SDX71217.1 hypothetical protein SAMN05518848_11274 [Paenibacillus sp. PDC88]SFS88585.1 hypothetical protein SAMN04488601_10670 [Paenibacillus sp. 453mf]
MIQIAISENGKYFVDELIHLENDESLPETVNNSVAGIEIDPAYQLTFDF